MATTQEMQEELLAQQMNSQFQENSQNLSNMTPDSNFESAVFLLTNSDNFTGTPEIEKEIKLANLDLGERNIIQRLLNSYQDLILLNDLQVQKFQTKLDKKDFIKLRQQHSSTKLDKLNFLRRAVSISTISRGKDGFERKSQNTIISQSKVENDNVNTTKLKQFFGGSN